MPVASETAYSRTALANKVAIVTGTDPGARASAMARATAIRLAQSGARALVVDFVNDSAEHIAPELISANGVTAAVEVGDDTEPADTRRLVKAALDRWGRLDIVVNNVGIAAPAERSRTLTSMPGIGAWK